MFRRAMLIALTSGCLTQTATGAPRLYVVPAVVESIDAAISVRLDTDGLNVVAFTVVFNNLSSCMDPVDARLGTDAIAAGLSPDSFGWGTGSAGTEAPIPPPYDQFLGALMPPPPEPIPGLAGSGLEIVQFHFRCVAGTAECPLRWEPADYSGFGLFQLQLADGTFVSVSQIDLVAPEPVTCDVPISVEQVDWGRVKSLYRDPRPSAPH